MNSALDHGEAFGNPDCQVVHGRHPLASLTPEQARARAGEALSGVIAILTSQAKRVVTLGQEPHSQRALSSARHHCSIRLSPEHVPCVGLPIIGRVVAGAPILAVENLDRYPEAHCL